MEKNQYSPTSLLKMQREKLLQIKEDQTYLKPQ